MGLVFTNNVEIINHYQVEPTIFFDHNVIKMALNYQSTTSTPVSPEEKLALATLNYSKADWNKLNQEMGSTSWLDKQEVFLKN